MNISQPEKHNAFLLPAAIVVFGLLLRLLYLYFNVHAPDFASPLLDPQLNDYWARALITGDWTPPPHADNPEIATTPYGRPPAYPWLLAVIYFLFRGSYLAPRCIQIAIGLANILLVYLLGKRLFGRASGAVTALLMSIFWASIYFEGELNSPTWEVFLSLSMILLLLHWASTYTVLSLSVAALCLGLGALMRPNILLPGALVLLWIFLKAYRGTSKLSKACAHACLFAGIVLLIISPVIVRNWRVGRQFVFISYYGGINAYIGNNPHSEGTEPEVPDLYEISGVEKWNCFNYPSIVRGMARHLDKPDLSFAGASHYFYLRALEFWREQPLQACMLTLRKAWLFWGPHEISDSKVVHYERLHSPILAYLPRFSHLLALVLTGMLGWRLFERKRSSGSETDKPLVLLFAAGYFISILPFFVSERYRFPILPLLLPFAGYGIILVYRFLRQKEFNRAFVFSLLAVPVYLAVSSPLFSYTPDHSKWHLHRGIAYAARGKAEDAVHSLLAAIAENPENDEAHLQLGYLYVKQGRVTEAMEHYHRALEANPNNVFAANNLGYEYYLQENFKEAEKYYRQALARQPIFTLALNNLGNALLHQGDADGALSCFEKVLDINEKDPFARYNIGNVYLETGRYEQAIENFDKAFTEAPFNPHIANNYGLSLARSGQLKESIPWFEKALSLAPNYPLAHFNLGNVYGDLGETQEACCHYEQVLATWPDHAETLQRSKLLCDPFPPLQ